MTKKNMDERKLHVTELRMLRWMNEVTKMDKVKNEYIRGSMKLPKKVRINRLALYGYGHDTRRDDNHISRRMLNGWM